MRKLLAGIAVVALLPVAALAAGYWYVLTARPPQDGVIRVPGLEAPVEIDRDSLGVPYLRAADELDLVFAQGYVHAQDRLWQMELMRRAGQGRLSEIFGAGLLDSDRFLRALELAKVARRDALAADSASGAIMAAYAAGVNAWLQDHRGALPPEFLLLRFRPEPWTSDHSLLVGRMMSLDLSLYRSTVRITRAARQLDSAQAASLLPFYPEWAPAIVESAPPPLPAAAAALLEAASIAHASNAWVVGGSRTRSGKPILANDMHLALQAPGIWYLMVLAADSLAVAGLSLPGVPYIIAGHNRALAWGFTNAMTDDADLFVERQDPADSTRYLAPAGSLPFELVSDSIPVRGQPRPAPFRYRRTRHGPVISDTEVGLGGEPLALRWISHEPSGALAAIRQLNHARDWSSLRAAVARFDDPHQNVVFADTGGDFGYVMGGRVPRRGDGSRRPPTLPVPGWTGEWDWQGYLDPEEHPWVRNPPAGYVITANNRQAAGALGDRVSTEWEPPFRALRLRQLIAPAHLLTAADVHVMQLDLRDTHAERYRDRAGAAARAAGLSRQADLLEVWDLEANADSHAAALYYVWLNRLRRELAARLYADTAGYLPRRLLDHALETRSLPWLPAGAGRAGFDSAASAAFRSAAAIVGTRTWGALHGVRIEHALGALRLARPFRVSIAATTIGGSETTVNVLHPRDGTLPAIGVYGVSQRHVVDLADVDGSGGFILPAGQSGLPFDHHYRDQFDRWRRGGLWLLPLDPEAAAARAVHRLRLEPD